MILNSQKMREDVEKIKSLYKSKGFYNTEVTPELTYPGNDRVDIDYHIQEGEKVYIKDIRFRGNKAFTDSQLEKVMATKEKGLLSWFSFDNF